MRLFARAMNEAHKAYGDMCIGSEIRRIHEYQWTFSVNGELVRDDKTTLWDFLCDHPYDPRVEVEPPARAADNWQRYNVVAFEALEQCRRDMLYLGAGAGRFSRAVETLLGLSCTNVDNSPEAIELMARRGIDAQLMDAYDLTFEDNSFPLVVVTPWAFDNDPEALLRGAGRVASERVIISGFQLSEDLDPVPYSETMDWEGETDSRSAFAYHHEHVIAMLGAVGMEPDQVCVFSEDLDHPHNLSWLLEARFAA